MIPPSRYIQFWDENEPFQLAIMVFFGTEIDFASNLKFAHKTDDSSLCSSVC